MIEWLLWLQNKSGFINFNILKISKKYSPDTPIILKFLQQKLHQLVGREERGALTPPPTDNVVGSEKLRSRMATG